MQKPHLAIAECLLDLTRQGFSREDIEAGLTANLITMFARDGLTKTEILEKIEPVIPLVIKKCHEHQLRSTRDGG